MEENTILLVEDNPDDEALTVRALKKNNLRNELIIARDGAEAIDYLFAEGQHQGRNINQLPALILLDLQLPKIDGFGVLKRLRADQRTRFLPVVVLTSSAEQEDILNAYGLGANSYVRKPVDFDEFIKTVGQLGPYWLVTNQCPAVVA
ncbi:MAG: response regulator [Gammaproteobacteria bacterium]|nr:response regulator [Gammaproteobacteria bacterium]